MPVRRPWTKWTAAVLIAITVLLLWQRNELLQPRPKPQVVAPTTRMVLRVWVCEQWTGSTAWIERQAAAFERSHPGMSLRIRRAQAVELTDQESVLPDLLVFAPGVLAAPDKFLTPIHGDVAVRSVLSAAGRWRGTQWALPVAMGGYGLLVNEEGQRDPNLSILDPDAMAGAARKAKGKQGPRYALQCAQGTSLSYPTALLAQGGGLGGGWPQGIARGRAEGTLPPDFALCSAEKAYGDFTSRSAMALVVTQRDVRRFRALSDAGKGFPVRLEQAREAFTDQLLLAGVVAGKDPDADRLALSTQFLWSLVGHDAQQGLTDHGLFPVRSDVPGYDPESAPFLYTMAATLAREDLWVPNAFTWGTQQAVLMARTEAALAQGDVDLPGTVTLERF